MSIYNFSDRGTQSDGSSRPSFFRNKFRASTAPRNLAATSFSNFIRLQWSEPEDLGRPAINGYKLNISGVGTIDVGNVTSYDWSGGSVQSTYNFDVYSNNGLFNSETSNSVSKKFEQGKNIVQAKIYATYAGYRAANYTVQYSDNGSSWTTAWTGVMSNNSSCGIQTGTGSGISAGYGRRRYWRYIEGSAVSGHHPRCSRILLTDSDGNNYNLVVFTSDNCSDSGQYQIGTRGNLDTL